MILILYDLIWWVVVFGLLYKAVLFVFTDHPHLFKVVFDVDFRFNNFNMELSSDRRHYIIHGIVTPITFVILSFNPILETILFMFYGFVDVVTLNRLVVYIILLKISFWVAPYGIIPKKIDSHMVIEITQLLFVLLNYSNTDVLYPVFFQLVDEAFELEKVVTHLLELYSSAAGNDTRINQTLTDIKVFMRAYHKKIKRAREFVLVGFLIISILLAEINTWGEIIFYYYAVLRLIQLHYEVDDKNQ